MKFKCPICDYVSDDSDWKESTKERIKYKYEYGEGEILDRAVSFWEEKEWYVCPCCGNEVYGKGRVEVNNHALLKTLRYVGINTIEWLLFFVGILIAGSAIMTIMAKLAPASMIVIFVAFIAMLLYTIYDDIRDKYREYKQEDED